MVKLLVLDLDGTLLDDHKQITSENKESILKAEKKGVRVALASGRHNSNLEKYGEALEMNQYNGFFIGNNGQTIYRYDDKSNFSHGQIPYIVGEICLKYAIKNHLVMYARNNDHPFYYKPYKFHSDNPYRNRPKTGYDAKEHTFKVKTDFDKIGFFLQPPTDSFKVVSDLKELIGDKADAFLVDSGCIEISKKGVNKAKGVEKILDLMGWNKNEVMIMGDGENDLEMLKNYPMSVAMDNALPEVKKASRYQTGNNNESGVAKAIDRYILKPQERPYETKK